MEDVAVEKDELAKKVVDLEALLKESESMLEESQLRAAKEREANKELEDELFIYKNEAAEEACLVDGQGLDWKPFVHVHDLSAFSRCG